MVDAWVSSMVDHFRSPVVDGMGKRWLTKPAMKASLLKEHPLFGSFAAIAAACGLSREAVRKWDLVPLDNCPAIESATVGAVTCEQLRPDVTWQRDSAGQVTGYVVPVQLEQKAA